MTATSVCNVGYNTSVSGEDVFRSEEVLRNDEILSTPFGHFIVLFLDLLQHSAPFLTAPPPLLVEVKVSYHTNSLTSTTIPERRKPPTGRSKIYGLCWLTTYTQVYHPGVSPIPNTWPQSCVRQHHLFSCHCPFPLCGERDIGIFRHGGPQLAYNSVHGTVAMGG